jgi:hypothetical protein
VSAKDIPVRGSALRGAVKPPNNTDPGNRAANSYLLLDKNPSTVRPANEPRAGDRRSGTMPLGGMSSPVKPPNHRFDVGLAKMPQPASADTPAAGAVPVHPFTGGGLPASWFKRGA